MKILIDMNLSPAWVSVLEEAGHTASHWSTIGSLNAPDREVLLWAKANGYLLFTHDLDFGAILAATEAEARALSKSEPKTLLPTVRRICSSPSSINLLSISSKEP
jgi:hypothetical protein